MPCERPAEGFKTPLKSAAAAPRPGFFFLLIKIKKIYNFPVEKGFFGNSVFCGLATGGGSAMVKNREKTKISKKNLKLRQQCCGKRKMCDRCKNNSKDVAGEHTET